jgi:hypothetical protein
MHQNNIFFYFLKIIFDINTSKRYENIKKIILSKKKKNIQLFLEIQIAISPFNKK